MYYVRLTCMYASLLCLFLLVIGLIKPWVVLWWEDVQNRRMAIRVYGSLALVFYLGYVLMGLLR
jgi:hypothetical protein